jgi:hypothetical protein
MHEIIVNVIRYAFIIGGIQLLMRSIIILLLSISLASCMDYQRRAIYLGEKDNVCHYGQQSDKIRLQINLDGLRTKTV